LLQTEDYMRALHSLGSLPDEEIERRVAARLRRQQRLTGPHPLTFAVVISEGALHRVLAEPGVAIAQLRHLASSAQRSTVSLRVLPFSAGLHCSMSGSFTVLEFAPGVSAQRRPVVPELTWRAWRKSTYSVDGGGNCVEWAESQDGCAVRDSQDPTGPVISVGRAQWVLIMAAIRRGQFG
jgi:hypothetical protein